MDKKKYRSLLFPFIINHILPEFRSPCAFLRSRACWTIEYFEEVDWDDQQATGAIDVIVQSLLGCLNDPSLSVQAAAASSLRTIVKTDAAKPIVAPVVSNIVTEMFRIMSDVENESVLMALCAIVEEYSANVVPIAPQMVEHLVKCFLSYSAEGHEDDEAAMAAALCLDALTAIVDVLDPDIPSNNSDITILRQVETLMMPTLYKIVSTEHSEFLDNGVQFMTQFTYYGDDISPNMWTLCGPLLVSLHTWAYDYIAEIVMPLLNFMSKDIKMFLTTTYNNQSLMQLLLQVVNKVLDNDDSERELEAKCGAILLKCLLICCKDNGVENLYSIWGPIYEMLCKKLTTPAPPKTLKIEGQGSDDDDDENHEIDRSCKTLNLKIKLLECIIAMLYADCRYTLTMMITPQYQEITDIIFNMLFSNFNNFEKAESQRLLVVSLSEVFASPCAILPPCIKLNISSLFIQTIREITLLNENGNDTCLAMEGYEDDDDDDDDDMMGDDDDDDDYNEDDDDGINDDDDNDNTGNNAGRLQSKTLDIVPDDGYNEDNDALNTEDRAYLKYLENSKKDEEAYKGHLYGAYDGGEPVDDEEPEFTSPLDKSDVLIYFMTAINQAQTNATISQNAEDMNHIQVMQSSLTTDDIERLARFRTLASERTQA